MRRTVASWRGRWVGKRWVLRSSSLVESDAFCFHRLRGLVCGFFDGFREYSLHYVCVLLFIYRTHGAPSVDVATGCLFRMSSPLHASSELTVQFTHGCTVKWKSLCWDSWISTPWLFQHISSRSLRLCADIMLTGPMKSSSPHTHNMLSINKQTGLCQSAAGQTWYVRKLGFHCLINQE